MISFVSVFNNEVKLNERLRASLARQQGAHQFVAIDNRGGRFGSASQALNHGAQEAVGDWIIFLHQDIELLGNNWIERAESYLALADPNGWHGVVGRDTTGVWQGLLRDRDMVFGKPVEAAIPVQTLDEIVLIHKRLPQSNLYFDPNLNGWHGYGVDACCTALRADGKNSVLPLPVFHDSPSTNQAGLRDAHQFIRSKHGQNINPIFTTCGVLPNDYGLLGSYKVARFSRWLAGWWTTPSWNRLAHRDTYEACPYRTLDSLTLEESTIIAHRGDFFLPSIECVGLCDRSNKARKVVHLFDSLATPFSNEACHLMMPEVGLQFFHRTELESPRKLLIAFHPSPDLPSPAAWRQRVGRSFTVHVLSAPDHTRWIVLDCRMTG